MIGEARRNNHIFRKVFGHPKLLQTKTFRTNR
jgi:hypothetical protein